MKKRYILIGILLVLVIGFAYLASFKVVNIKVSGCEVVNEQVIIDAVKERSHGNNTILLYLSCKFHPIENIPFVSKVDIEFESKNTVSVTVYEKSMAGCVEYMDGYVFFDKDGTILESASNLIPGIPCIRGLNFEGWEVGTKLPIDDESKFQSILTITQLIDKYQLSIDGIKFTPENEIVLYHGGITIELGKGEYLAIQMMNLGSILEGLEGLEGTLYMKDFNSDEATANFSKNKPKKNDDKKKKEDSKKSDGTDETSKEPEGQEETYDEESYDEESYDEESYDEESYDDEDSYDENEEESYDEEDGESDESYDYDEEYEEDYDNQEEY